GGHGGCGCDHVFTPPDQMTQTGLMKRLGKTIVGPPAVMIQESAVIFTQYGGGLCESTTGQNRIDGDLGAHTNPEPFQMRRHFPPGLIELIDETLTDGDLKSLIGRFRVPSQSRHGAAKCATAS